jgi:hypothetical protein
MKRILDTILIMAIVPLTLYVVEERSWFFAISALIGTTAITVALKRPVFGIDLLAALLFFHALKEIHLVFELFDYCFAVPVFMASLALEAAKRHYGLRLFEPAAAVVVAAVALGSHPLGLDVLTGYEGDRPVTGAVGGLLVGQVMLLYIKKDRLLRLTLPIVVTVAGWLAASLRLVGGEHHHACNYLLVFFLPNFALPAVAAVAIIESNIQGARGRGIREAWSSLKFALNPMRTYGPAKR